MLAFLTLCRPQNTSRPSSTPVQTHSQATLLSDPLPRGRIVNSGHKLVVSKLQITSVTPHLISYLIHGLHVMRQALNVTPFSKVFAAARQGVSRQLSVLVSIDLLSWQNFTLCAQDQIVFVYHSQRCGQALLGLADTE